MYDKLVRQPSNVLVPKSFGDSMVYTEIITKLKKHFAMVLVGGGYTLLHIKKVIYEGNWHERVVYKISA